MRILTPCLFLALVGSGCATAKSAELTAGGASRSPATPLPASSPVTVGGVTVQMTAATLAEDCGGAGAPWTPPVPGPAPKANEKASSRSESMVEHVCRQTSMQLSVVSGILTSPTEIRVKKVEIFDASGKSIGELASRSPMVWSAKDGSYGAWDQKVVSSQKLSVSYALSAPDWTTVPNRWGQTFTIKATVTVGGSDQTLQRKVGVEAEVETYTPVHLPPGAVT